MNFTGPSSAASCSNTAMNVSPMRLRLVSGSTTPASSSRKAVGGIDMPEVDVEVLADGGDHALGLFAAEETVIDEDAGELVADGALDQRRGHGRIDPTAEGADDAPAAHLRTDARHAAGDEGGGGPGALAAADAADEVLQDAAAILRVDDLRVEQDAEEAVVAAHPRDRRGGRWRPACGSRGGARRRGPRGSSRPGSTRTARRRAGSAARRGGITACPNSRAWAGSTLPPSSCAISCMP